MSGTENAPQKPVINQKSSQKNAQSHVHGQSGVQQNELSKAGDAAKHPSSAAPAFSVNAKTASKDSPLAKKLEKTVGDIFSRCGVPYSNFKISDPVEFNAKVVYSLNWSFKCRCQDKVMKRVADDQNVLSFAGLDEFTSSNAKELEKGNAKTKDFIKHLSSSDFSTLSDLSGQIVAFNRVAAIGRTKCKTCHGNKTISCSICDGKGHVPCPACHGAQKKCQVCHGLGHVICAHCQSKGVVPCKECNSTGEQIVEREIIYDAECVKNISVSMVIPGTNKHINTFTDDDKNVLIDAAEFSEPHSGNETNRGYNATFIGSTKCCAVHVQLEGVNAPFDFILCGKSLKAVCKPNVLDYIFASEASVLSETLLSSSDDVDEKIKCVKVMASKAIIAKTIRSIEGHEIKLAKEIASKQGVTVESILNDTSNIDNYKAKALRLKIRHELLNKVSEEFISNAEGYVSKDFAQTFARNLITFVPMLVMINPNTKFIWAGITLGTWLTMTAFIYMVPTLVGALIEITLSAVICAFTSFALTKNWVYYSAVSMLKITHKMKKVPDLSTEAVQSGRLMIGALIIGLAGVLGRLFNFF